MTGTLLTRREMTTLAAGDFDGRRVPDAELAERFGITRSAVAQRRSRARKKLAASPSPQARKLANCLRRGKKRIKLTAMQITFRENASS